MQFGNLLILVGRAALAGSLLLASVLTAQADETDAREILSAMSDYLADLDQFSFDYDEYHEVVTTDGERLGLASSGAVTVGRPDRIRVHRNAGFTEISLAFDGKTLMVHDAASALFVRAPIQGTLDHLIDTLRNEHGRPLPAADLLVGAVHEGLMQGVTEVKDLGVGIIGGTICEHLAFRAEEVDWQIWIAQGDAPYPCMFIITSKQVEHAPQYRVTLRNWRDDSEGVAFSMETPAAATEVEMDAFLSGARTYPENYILEGKK